MWQVTMRHGLNLENSLLYEEENVQKDNYNVRRKYYINKYNPI